MADEERVVEKAPRRVYEQVYVKAGKRDGKVALWDRDMQHPNPDHEVYVADGTPPTLAARNPEVERALADGRLVQTDEAEARDYEARAARREVEAEEARKESKDNMATLGAKPVEPVEVRDDEKRGPGRPAAGSTATSR